MRNPALCAHLCTSQVELRLFAGKDVGVPGSGEDLHQAQGPVAGLLRPGGPADHEMLPGGLLQQDSQDHPQGVQVRSGVGDFGQAPATKSRQRPRAERRRCRPDCQESLRKTDDTLRCVAAPPRYTLFTKDYEYAFLLLQFGKGWFFASHMLHNFLTAAQRLYVDEINLVSSAQ